MSSCKGKKPKVFGPKMTNVRLSPHFHEIANDFAAEHNCTKNAVMEVAILMMEAMRELDDVRVEVGKNDQLSAEQLERAQQKMLDLYQEITFKKMLVKRGEIRDSMGIRTNSRN